LEHSGGRVDQGRGNSALKILVTGASGFIGTHLIPQLVQLGHDVRTMSRGSAIPARLAGLKIEHVYGDVSNPEAVKSAVRGCKIVYHLAGLVSYKKKDQARQYGTNVLGTRYVMAACLQAGVERVVHTSSVAALGIPKDDTMGTEDLAYNLSGKGLGYCDTKHEAEQEVLQAYKDGLNVVMLNPGIIFGEGDTHPHHHAIFAAMSKGSLIGVPPGGVTFSDINDVVKAEVACIERGKAGERYVIVSANLTYMEAAAIFAKVAGSRPPLFAVPGPLISLAGFLSEEILPAFGIIPPLTRQNAWLSRYKIFFSSEKAVQELGISFTPFEETVRRTAPYYLRRGSEGTAQIAGNTAKEGSAGALVEHTGKAIDQVNQDYTHEATAGATQGGVDEAADQSPHA
jgi:dihydroflavonol-4-reductase